MLEIVFGRVVPMDDALNYNSIANLDDDSCNYQVCPDFNGDGEVQAQDLLDFLLAWGTTY